MSGLSLGANLPNLKFAYFGILELLSFNAQKSMGSHDPVTPVLASKFSGVSDLQGVEISVFPLTFLVIVTTVLTLPRSL